ncbi:MAG: cytochrome ubiquinol oxidase subunit I [Nitrososphaerota archaeon]
MNELEFFGFSLLGLSVLIHIVFVNITIGTGWISAVSRYLSWRRMDADLELMSRRVFRILVITELFSGVWGTIMTVILAGIFPTLLALATDVLFYPILISLTSIIIRIPSIAVFWYTWGRISPRTHSVIGLVMAVSGLGVPIGFRYIFAEITSPYAIRMALEGMKEEARLAVFLNPTYPPLILHTIAGAMLVGSLMTASYFATKNNMNVKYSRYGILIGLPFVVLQGFAGTWYLLSLMTYSPILFRNLMGIGGVTFNAGPIFIAKVLVIAVILFMMLMGYRGMKRESNMTPSYVAHLGTLGVVMLIISEFLNDGARYPYMVLIGEDGLPPINFMNVYMDIPLPIVYVILGSLMVLTGVFLLIFYYALNKRYLPEIPA